MDAEKGSTQCEGTQSIGKGRVAVQRTKKMRGPESWLKKNTLCFLCLPEYWQQRFSGSTSLGLGRRTRSRRLEQKQSFEPQLRSSRAFFAWISTTKIFTIRYTSLGLEKKNEKSTIRRWGDLEPQPTEVFAGNTGRFKSATFHIYLYN